MRIRQGLSQALTHKVPRIFALQRSTADMFRRKSIFFGLIPWPGIGETQERPGRMYQLNKMRDNHARLATVFLILPYGFGAYFPDHYVDGGPIA